MVASVTGSRGSRFRSPLSRFRGKSSSSSRLSGGLGSLSTGAFGLRLVQPSSGLLGGSKMMCLVKN